MARSHHRHKKYHPQQQHAASTKQKRKATPLMTGFIGFLGLGIAYIATDGNIPILIAGAIVGGVAGYFIGKAVDNEKVKK